jgi:hypothetical protein
MRKFSSLVAVAALISFQACSKKEQEQEATPPPAAVAEAPVESVEPPAAPAPVAAKRDWNAVVTEIARLKMQRPLPEEKRERMLQLQDELTTAAASDPDAREAYSNLTKILTGR